MEMTAKNARIPALLLAVDREQAVGHELKLELDGYAVTTVSSVDEALARAKVSHPLVVFAAEPRLAQAIVRVAAREPALAGIPVIGLAQGTGRAILLKPALHPLAS
jgi:hypothetical protein